MNMDRNRLHVLFAEHSDGKLTAEEHAELQERLRADAEARRLWFLHQDVEEGLHAMAQQGASAVAADVMPAKAARARRGWLQWRPLTAAAAGLVLGLFSASVVFAYAVPRVPLWTERALALADAGFEQGTAPAAEGVPVRFGLWSGDFTESTVAQQGVTPKEGRRMLRFLRADSAVSAPGGTEKSGSGNLYQVVDLRAWREEIADGQAVVDWSAWYQWVPGAEEGGMQFMTNVWAFTGTTEILPRNWKEHLYQETAKSSHRMNAEEARGAWRETAGRMTVPADADFLVIELKAIPQSPTADGEAYRFSGCFADDVRLVLRSHAQQGPQHAAAPPGAAR